MVTTTLAASTLTLSPLSKHDTFEYVHGNRDAYLAKNTVYSMPATCDTIETFVDRMSKYVYFVPYKSMISTEELVQLFIATVVSRHGMLKRIISDRDGGYLSRYW